MLPTSRDRAGAALLAALSVLRDCATVPEPDPTALQEGFQRVKAIFQKEGMALTGSGFDSLRTEIHRGLRLLEIDILFWQSSRQAATSRQRLAKVRDRIEQLANYLKSWQRAD